MATHTTDDTEENMDDAQELADSSDERGDEAEGEPRAEVPEASAEEETQTTTLDELEAEELEMLTDDESDETLVIDEAAEMRAIRRAEISMQVDSIDEATTKEFVCSSCFLVKRESQLANKRKKICFDCAS